MPLSDRRSARNGHILIGGTGRAGTTLLVQYFTVLGFDTGFSVERVMSGVDPISKAGLEHPVPRVVAKGGKMPYVSKSPKYGKNLYDYLDSGEIKVKHCIIPVRELGAAAASRHHVTDQAVARGKSVTDMHPGGIVGARSGGGNQKRRLAIQFHTLVHTMLHFDVPIHFLKFPEFARRDQDLFEALNPIMVEHGVSRGESDEALAKVLRPEYIHDFPTS